MPYFDRFDIAEAHWLFFCHWHDGGALYARYSGQFSRIGFRPSPMLVDVEDLTENGQAIYHQLVEKLQNQEV